MQMIVSIHITFKLNFVNSRKENVLRSALDKSLDWGNRTCNRNSDN